MLADSLADERVVAVRELLASPLLDVAGDADAFRLVVRHAPWLIEYFEQTCGWALTVDPAAGFARLVKRGVALDTTRPLRRTRGSRAPFDRRRYELLCLVCAELVRHPVTTIGLLSSSVGAGSQLDTARYGERSAFVDALRVLVEWGALRVTAGDVDGFVDSERANAILVAETSRIHRLLASATAPSAVPPGASVDDAIDALSSEPRYVDEAEVATASDDARNRWARHRLARRVLDDPVVYDDDLAQVERDYLSSLSGRRWLRDRVAQAGFELEERSEGIVAVDPDAIATDARFPAPLGNAHQLALLLIGALVRTRAGVGVLGRLSPVELRHELDSVLAEYPGWARGQRDGDGPERLLADAIDLLARFRLAKQEPDGTVVALPAIARYRPGTPVVTGAPTLFEEDL